MPISVRLNSKDELLIKKYAKMHNISISELVRDSVIARIEDEIDLAAYDKAMQLPGTKNTTRGTESKETSSLKISLSKTYRTKTYMNGTKVSVRSADFLCIL